MSTVAFIGLGAMGSRLMKTKLPKMFKRDSCAVFLQASGEKPKT